MQHIHSPLFSKVTESCCVLLSHPITPPEHTVPPLSPSSPPPPPPGNRTLVFLLLNEARTPGSVVKAVADSGHSLTTFFPLIALYPRHEILGINPALHHELPALEIRLKKGVTSRHHESRRYRKLRRHIIQQPCSSLLPSLGGANPSRPISLSYDGGVQSSRPSRSKTHRDTDHTEAT